MKINRLISKYPRIVNLLLTCYNYTIAGNSVSRKCKLKIHSSKLNRCKIRTRGENNEIIIESLCRLRNCTIYIHGNCNKVWIQEKCMLKDTTIYIEDDDNEVVIGEHTHIHGKTELAAIEGTRIIIGTDALFANDIEFRTGDSHSLLNQEGKRINPSKDIILGDHVWIGSHVNVLKGVIIGGHSVVGAGSVVTGKYKQNTVIAGNPAVEVKQSIDWISERIQI